MLLVDDRLKAAHEHAAAGRHDNAALLYESILDLSPGHPEALGGLIETRLAEGDLEGAKTLLSKATPKSELDPGFLALAAKVCLFGDNAPEAEQLTDRALAIDPYHVQAALLKAEFLAAAGALADVEELLTGVRARQPDREILHGIARLYYTHGLLGPALVTAREALDLAPDNAPANALFGQILTALEDHGQATPYLEKAHLQQPANAEHLIALANNAAATGQLTEAGRYAERVRTLYPELMPAWLCYINVKASRGEAGEALREFAPVAKAAKDRTEAILTLAAAYRLAGEPDKTLQLLEPQMAESARLQDHHRARLFSALRDAYLSTGQLDRLLTLGEDTAATGNEAAGNEEVGEVEAGDMEALARHLNAAAMVIDPGLSHLEMMVLARFVGPAGRGPDTPVAGPAASRQLARLFGFETYLPTDAPEAPAAEISGSFPVSRLLHVPPGLRGGLTGAVPYLPVREDLLAKWQAALADHPRPWIGLAWNEAAPGLTLAPLLSALPQLPGTLVSTVWDHSRAQLSGQSGILDAGRHIRQLEDLAALVHTLDFVIAPDGMVLHAAGAAGTPGLAVVPHNRPWYWHAPDTTSLWYPSLEVIAAPRPGHWADLMPELAPAIAACLSGRLETAPAPGA